MKRSGPAAAALFPLLLLPLLLLGGCAQLFEFNLFQSLDPVPLPTQEELAAMSEGEALNYLGEELASPVFVEKLLEDEAAFASVEDYLEATMAGSAEPDNRMRAAVLYADLHLVTSGADEAVNNVAALLQQDPGSLDFADEAAVVDFLQALLPDIIPAEALASRQAFDELLSGFQAAWDGYQVFGNGLGADPAVPEGVNLGDVAQKALFSYLVAESLEDGRLYASESEARDALWAIARGQEPPLPAGAFEDPFAAGTPLQNILDAAGISF
jgi:hypothetical protein